jgi:hypothetical protein
MDGQENPYRSPLSESPPKGTYKELKTRNELLRFLLHIIIASFLAPYCGAFLRLLLGVRWKDPNLTEQIINAFFGSFILLFFIYFIIIPFGIASYIVCWFLYSFDKVDKPIWIILGGVTGVLFGLLVAIVASEDIIGLVIPGLIVGIISGWMLALLWKPSAIEQS